MLQFPTIFVRYEAHGVIWFYVVYMSFLRSLNCLNAMCLTPRLKLEKIGGFKWDGILSLSNPISPFLYQWAKFKRNKVIMTYLWHRNLKKKKNLLWQLKIVSRRLWWLSCMYTVILKVTHQQIFSQLEFFFFFSSTQKLFLIRLSLELWNPISFQPHMPPFYHFLF